jgi:hypothetical protein
MVVAAGCYELLAIHFVVLDIAAEDASAHGPCAAFGKRRGVEFEHEPPIDHFVRTEERLQRLCSLRRLSAQTSLAQWVYQRDPKKRRVPKEMKILS